ncbi:MAG: helix-turn-helix transcriptional regulator [Phycisphaerales bacterium JB060]
MKRNQSYGEVAERRLGRVDDVCRLLGLSRTTVYEMARDGTLPGVVRAGRRVMFDMEKVGAWIDDGGHKGWSEA